MLVTENFVGFIWLSSLSIWAGPSTDIMSCAVGMRLIFPILGAEYPAKPKAGAADVLREPSRFGGFMGFERLGVLGVLSGLGGVGGFGSLSLFISNLFKDCSIGFAIAPNGLGGAFAGSVPKLIGLAALLTGCSSAGSLIGDTCVAAGALENGSLNEYEAGVLGDVVLMI